MNSFTLDIFNFFLRRIENLPYKEVQKEVFKEKEVIKNTRKEIDPVFVDLFTRESYSFY